MRRGVLILPTKRCIMFSLLVDNLLWTQGSIIALVVILVAVASFFIYRPLFFVMCCVFLFLIYFFRNPDRVCLQAINDPTILICPADGKVIDIKVDKNNGLEGYAQRVSIFLSPLDVHVQWTPVAGVVEKVAHRAGAFKMAYLPKSSDLNERNDLHLRMQNGKTILVRQIAGLIVRRICCWVREGEQVKRGQKYGMVRFGSRVDIFLPADVEINVGVGEHVYGGQTVLGRWTA
jgi:phosphatidylserine decarboxylase